MNTEGNERVFTQREPGDLTLFATQAAIAIENARLYEAAQRELAERTRAEEALTQYRLLAEQARDIVLFVRRDGQILEANRAAIAAYGYTSEELLALYIQDLRASETQSLTAEQMAQADSEGILFETLHRRKDGSTFPVEVSSRSTTLDGERVLLSIVRDITKRRRAEEGLTRRTHQLEAIRNVNEEIARELDLTVLLELITQRAVDLVGAGDGTIRLWDEAEQTLVPKAWTRSSARRVLPLLRLGEGVAGTAAQRREGLIVNDFRASAYAVPAITQDSSHTAVLAEPLLYHDRLVGVISIDREPQMHPFTEEDRKLIALFAAQAAVAIENARLYEPQCDGG